MPKRLTFDRLATALRRKLKMQHSLEELEPELVNRERIFRAPPLTPELVAALKIIAPHFHLRTSQRSREFWELQQNGVCWGEYEVLKPFMDLVGTPSKVLDIGPGLGRSAVFFKKIRQWEEVPFHLYDATGEANKYTMAGPRFNDSFCGNLDALRFTLKYNGIEHCEIFDAATMGGAWPAFPALTTSFIRFSPSASIGR